MVPEVREGWRLKMVQGRVQERTECNRESTHKRLWAG